MPPTNTNSSIIDSLRHYALEEVKEKQRDMEAEKSKFESHFGTQDAKPIDKVLYFERAAAALDVEKNLASKFVGNSDGTFPCPSCFIRGKNNILNHDIHYGDGSAFHCVICNSIFHVLS